MSLTPKLKIVEKLMFTQNNLSKAEHRLRYTHIPTKEVNLTTSQSHLKDFEDINWAVQQAVDLIENNHSEQALIVVCSLQLLVLKTNPDVTIYDISRQTIHIDEHSHQPMNIVGDLSGVLIVLDPYRVSNSKPIQVFATSLDALIEVKINGTIRFA